MFLIVNLPLHEVSITETKAGYMTIQVPKIQALTIKTLEKWLKGLSEKINLHIKKKTKKNGCKSKKE